MKNTGGMPYNVSIEALNYYLPEQRETGEDLKRDNPDWSIADIEKKTGVKSRFISKSNQTAVDLAIEAANLTLRGVDDKETIDGLIFVSQSPDYVLPTSACIIQERLQLSKNCMAFDINQGCSGYIYGLAISASLLESGVVSRLLLLCSDTYTKYINKNDRTCRPIFSDGAAATLLKKSKRALMGPFELGSDGKGSRNLIVKNSGARTYKELTKAEDNRLFMDGAKVFMFSMNAVPSCVNGLLKKAGKSIQEIDIFIFHQASKIVLDNIIRHLNLPEEKVFCNYQEVGNTVSATIPIALKDASDKGRVKSGDTVMMVGFGVGYSWGACLLEWEGGLG